jgi:cytochrome b subunit of formate dehydrogenase
VHRQKAIFWGPSSMVANWNDVKDLVSHLRWFVGLGKRPQFDRYAYWEKFDYWAVFWGMIVIGFSGYAMWFAPFFAHFLPGWALNAVLVIHSEEGLLAILFIFSIHFVNTHLRPDSFPMDMVVFTGVESEEEFKHKRPMEYERLVKSGKLESRLGEAPQTWLVNFSRVVGTIAILVGLTLLVLTLTAYFS